MHGDDKQKGVGQALENIHPQGGRAPDFGAALERTPAGMAKGLERLGCCRVGTAPMCRWESAVAKEPKKIGFVVAKRGSFASLAVGESAARWDAIQPSLAWVRKVAKPLLIGTADKREIGFRRRGARELELFWLSRRRIQPSVRLEWLPAAVTATEADWLCL